MTKAQYVLSRIICIQIIHDIINYYYYTVYSAEVGAFCIVCNRKRYIILLLLSLFKVGVSLQAILIRNYYYCYYYTLLTLETFHDLPLWRTQVVYSARVYVCVLFTRSYNIICMWYTCSYHTPSSHRCLVSNELALTLHFAHHLSCG